MSHEEFFAAAAKLVGSNYTSQAQNAIRSRQTMELQLLEKASLWLGVGFEETDLDGLERMRNSRPRCTRKDARPPAAEPAMAPWGLLHYELGSWPQLTLLECLFDCLSFSPQHKWPLQGWEEHRIEQLLQTLANMDSNNFSGEELGL